MADNRGNGAIPLQRSLSWWRTPLGRLGQAGDAATASIMDLFGVSNLRAIIAVTTAVLFALKVFLAAIPMPIGGTGDATLLVPVCTAQGPKWIPADNGGAPDPVKTATSLCPFCVAFAGFALLLPAATQLIRRARLGSISVRWHLQAPLHCRVGRPPPGRGPPLLSH